MARVFPRNPYDSLDDIDPDAIVVVLGDDDVMPLSDVRPPSSSRSSVSRERSVVKTADRGRPLTLPNMNVFVKLSVPPMGVDGVLGITRSMSHNTYFPIMRMFSGTVPLNTIDMRACVALLYTLAQYVRIPSVALKDLCLGQIFERYGANLLKYHETFLLLYMLTAYGAPTDYFLASFILHAFADFTAPDEARFANIQTVPHFEKALMATFATRPLVDSVTFYTMTLLPDKVAEMTAMVLNERRRFQPDRTLLVMDSLQILATHHPDIVSKTVTLPRLLVLARDYMVSCLKTRRVFNSAKAFWLLHFTVTHYDRGDLIRLAPDYYHLLFWKSAGSVDLAPSAGLWRSSSGIELKSTKQLLFSFFMHELNCKLVDIEAVLSLWVDHEGASILLRTMNDADSFDPHIPIVTVLATTRPSHISDELYPCLVSDSEVSLTSDCHPPASFATSCDVKEPYERRGGLLYLQSPPQQQETTRWQVDIPSIFRDPDDDDDDSDAIVADSDAIVADSDAIVANDVNIADDFAGDDGVSNVVKEQYMALLHGNTEQSQ